MSSILMFAKVFFFCGFFVGVIGLIMFGIAHFYYLRSSHYAEWVRLMNSDEMTRETAWWIRAPVGSIQIFLASMDLKSVHGDPSLLKIRRGFVICLILWILSIAVLALTGQFYSDY